jgi:hypothetical protein
VRIEKVPVRVKDAWAMRRRATGISETSTEPFPLKSKNTKRPNALAATVHRNVTFGFVFAVSFTNPKS